MEKLVSIIIPVYNAEKFIRQTIASIQTQTYQNFELLLINDGSNDSSPEILDELAKKDKRLQVIHQENGGISMAQNRGLDEAKGDYISFCDNDDLYHPQYLEILIRALEETEADLAKARWQRPGQSQVAEVYYPIYQYENLKLTSFDRAFEKYQTVFSKALRRLRHLEAYYFNEANWCKLYRKETFEKIRFPLNRYAQDVSLAGPLLSQTKKVVDVDTVLYYWVQHESSVTHHRRNFRFLSDNIVAGTENFNLALRQGIPPYRNYFMLQGTLSDIKKLDEDHSEYIRQIKKDYLDKMPHKIKAEFYSRLRRFENIFYDHLIHSRK